MRVRVFLAVDLDMNEPPNSSDGFGQNWLHTTANAVNGLCQRVGGNYSSWIGDASVSRVNAVHVVRVPDPPPAPPAPGVTLPDAPVG